MKNRLLALILLTGQVLGASAAEVPDWFAEHVTFMTRDGGSWLADNSVYQSEQETWDAFGLLWEAGIHPHTMTGRLFGVTDGNPSQDFWHFRVFWHPGKNEVVVQQFGVGGAYGVGTMIPTETGEIRLLQTFSNPDGSTQDVGHLSSDEQDTHRTQSFNIADDGAWTPRRTYVWIRSSD